MKVIKLNIPYYSLIITEDNWIFEVFIKVSLNKQFIYSIGVGYKELKCGRYICSIFGKSTKKDPEITFFMDAINRYGLNESDIEELKVLYTKIINQIYNKVAKPVDF